MSASTSTDPTEVPDHQTAGLLWAVTWLRLAGLAWSAVVVVIDVNGSTEIRGGLAAIVLAVLTVWTLLLGWLARRRPVLLTRAAVLVVDVTLASSVAALDHVVYEGSHPQTFASVWPMSAAVVAGLLRGSVVGGVAGAVIGTSAALGTAFALDDGLEGRWTASLGTVVLLVVAGVLAGLVTVVLRRADAAEARAAALEQVARRLHDGVLQTLAVIQRRSDDPALVALARDQELQLRDDLDDARALSHPLPSRSERLGRSGEELAAALRRRTTEAERLHGTRCELVVADLPEHLPTQLFDAIDGAVGEALTNAMKHAAATRVVVFVDTADDQLTCTVNDDGVGFDPGSTPEGTGLRGSVRGRLDEVGGTVEVRSRPGHGCELVVQVPLAR